MRVDDPFGSPMSAGLFRSRLSSGWHGGPYETWYVPDGDGAVAGWYRVEFPDLENLNRALIGLIVHPGAAARGARRGAAAACR